MIVSEASIQYPIILVRFQPCSQLSISAVVPGDQESQLQRLLLVKSRITVRRVIQAQILVHKSFATAGTLCHRVTSKLEMHATQEGAMLFMNLER